MDEWKELKLKDATVKIGSGATPRGGKESYKGGRYALIRSQNVYNDYFHHDGIVYINDKQAAELQNVEVLEDDVLLNITGDSVARCCQVVPDILPARVNQHVAIIRTQPDTLDSRFLRYKLVSHQYQSLLLSLAAAGATRPALTKSMIENLEISTPPLQTQRAIAHILGTLDDKIELNNQINSTLESMAKAIFKEWFIDFGPVKAKAAGKKPFGMDDETAALFPDSFEESELGEIPRGWRVGSISNFCSNPRETIKENESKNHLYLGLEHLPQGSFSISSVGSSLDVVSNKFKFKKNQTLFGKLRPYFKKVIPAPFDGICSTDILVLEGKADFYNEFVLIFTSDDRFIEFNTQASQGTKMPRTSWEIMNAFKMPLPSEKIIKCFSKLVSPLIKMITHSYQEQKHLAEVRNLLLPKLISGEICV